MKNNPLTDVYETIKMCYDGMEILSELTAKYHKYENELVVCNNREMLKDKITVEMCFYKIELTKKIESIYEIVTNASVLDAELKKLVKYYNNIMSELPNIEKSEGDDENENGFIFDGSETNMTEKEMEDLTQQYRELLKKSGIDIDGEMDNEIYGDEDDEMDSPEVTERCNELNGKLPNE